MAVSARKLAPGGPAGYCLPVSGMVACRHKYGLRHNFRCKALIPPGLEGLVRFPAITAVVGDAQVRRFAALACGRDRAVPSMRLSLEWFCDDR
jgi:hypothetical protein